MNSVWLQNAGIIAASRAVKKNRRVYLSISQLLNILLCIPFIPPLLIVMVIIAIAIKLDSPGPVFFVQERVGRYGRRFKMYKFRTYSHNHDPQADKAFMKAYISGKASTYDEPTRPRYKPNNEAQITRMGRLLRKTSLDETPQILNILRGQMSLIGPRPNIPWEVETYQLWHTERLDVLPGITGLAQVKGRSNLCFDELVRYDIHYVRNQSLILDLRILWWTVLTVFTGQGAG
ncbi:MAG TPA: sugar transferase [Anaerolineales bacterium]|nr:sugar transferase [Anaerolineales bacterium]